MSKNYAHGTDVDVDEYRRALRSLTDGLGAKGDVLLQEANMNTETKGNSPTKVTVSFTVIPDDEHTGDVVALQRAIFGDVDD